MSEKKVYILPCSGIGKIFGSIGREAAFILLEELRKDKTKKACLPLIMKGNHPELLEDLKNNPIITIEGCTYKCAFHDTMEAVGKVDFTIKATDIVKENRGIRPERDIFPLRGNAKILARKLAEKIALKVDEFLENSDMETAVKEKMAGSTED